MNLRVKRIGLVKIKPLYLYNVTVTIHQSHLQIVFSPGQKQFKMEKSYMLEQCFDIDEISSHHRKEKAFFKKANVPMFKVSNGMTFQLIAFLIVLTDVSSTM